jgi:hypothetical protein
MLNRSLAPGQFVDDVMLVHRDWALWEQGQRSRTACAARRADVGQGDDVSWIVLADPEGNEFCVLRDRPTA